jgi:hypothetical protein
MYSEKGQAQADLFCNTHSGCNAKPGPLLARKSGGCCTKPQCSGTCGPDDWRCYSPSCLTANHSGYRPGAVCKEYCTEGAKLASIIATCELPPAQPPSATTSYSHVMYSDEHGSPGSWKYSASFQPGVLAVLVLYLSVLRPPVGPVVRSIVGISLASNAYIGVRRWRGRLARRVWRR